MAFTKQFLETLGIVIDKDEVSDEEGAKLIKQSVETAKNNEATAKAEATKLKGMNDTYSSQIAEFKRKEQANMTDEQKRQADMEAQKQQITDLQRQLALRDKVADLVELGYDKDTATKYATDELEGKPTIQYQKDFKAKIEAEAKAEALKNGNPPHINNNDNPPTKEQVVAGGYEAMAKLAKEKPEVYKQYFGEENQ